MTKTTFTLIKTEAVTHPKQKDVFSILAVESDGETAFTELAYDVARDPKTANELLKKIEWLSPDLSEFIDTVAELL